MKGIIVNCLQELVVRKFGKGKWQAALEIVKIDKNSSFFSIQNIDDATVLKIIKSVCMELNITPDHAADAFGEYWVNVFAPKAYKAYYANFKNARDMILQMDSIHEKTTKNMSGAHPPRFDYNWKNDKTLIITYKSHRHLIDFMVGLIKGIGIYFKEDLKVIKLTSTKVEVTFPT